MTNTDIHINTTGTVEHLAEATAPLIGAGWEALWNGEEHIMVWLAGVARVVLVKFTFEDDQGIEFSKHSQRPVDTKSKARKKQCYIGPEVVFLRECFTETRPHRQD